MAYILSTFLAHFMELFTAWIMLSNLYRLKKSKPVTIIAGIVIFSVVTVIFLAVNQVALNLTICFIALFIFAYFFFDCSVFSAVLLAIIMDAAITGSEFLAMNFLSLIFDYELKDYASTDMRFFLMVIISKLIYFLLCQVISHLAFFVTRKRNVQEKVTNKTPLFLLIYPVNSVFVCTLFWQLSLEYELTKNINVFAVVICALFLISIVATYFLYHLTARKEAEVYELQGELERKEIDEAYYKLLDHQNEGLKTLVHDEKNHLAAIKGMTDMAEVEKYVDKIYSDLNRYSSGGKTKNKMLDLILDRYSGLCQTEGIDFSVTANTSNLSFMENVDVTTLMSNILDNAVEAAKHSQERKIELTLNHAAGCDILTCVNSADNSPQSVAGKLKTTKKEKGFHGVGTKSIKRVASKYRGEYQWEYNEKNKIFITTIVFDKKAEDNI